MRSWSAIPRSLALAVLGLAAGAELAGAAASPALLAEAAKRADTRAVGALLQRRVDVNEPGTDGATALHWAANQNDLAMATLLIRAGARVDAPNRLGVTPFALAATTGNAALVDLFLGAGADANAASAEGETVLMKAALTGNAEVVKTLLAHGAAVNAAEKWRGQTALMWAAAEGHTEVVDALLAAGAEVGTRASAGFTPLLFAVRDGRIDVVRRLLTAGASPNDRIAEKLAVKGTPTGEDGFTSALTIAIVNAHYELAALLLEKGADSNAADTARGSPLHALAWMRRPGLPEGRDKTPPRPTGTVDALDLATRLLAKGANPNVRITWKEIRFDRDDGEARDPAYINVGRSYITYVGATPFYLAAKNADVALMRLLAEHGADTRMPTIQQVTPLMAAAGLGFWEGETPSPASGVPEKERLEAVKLALELGGDVNAVTDFGRVHLAGESEQLLYDFPENLEELPPSALADVRWGGCTALHGAMMLSESDEQQSIVRVLVDHGARLDARSTLGWTSLMLAEGVKAAGHVRESPAAAELVRSLMRQHDLDPAAYAQKNPLAGRLK